MALSSEQILKIKNMVNSHVKEKLWQALLSEADATKESMKGRFNHAFHYNASLQTFITALQNKFVQADLSFKQTQKSIETYFDSFESVLPQYMAEVGQLSGPNKLADAFQSLQIRDIERANGVELAVDILDDTKERVQPNQREYFTNERLVRRMDSLARLLSLQSKTSVCTAVTMHGGQLFIGANVSGDTLQADMVDAFKSRVQVLRQFINELNREEIALDNPNLGYKIEQCVHQLVAFGGTSKPMPMLKQALFKVVDALRNRRITPGSVNYFSPAERHALLTSENLTILLAEGKRYKKEKVPNYFVAYQFAGLSGEPQLLKHLVSQALQRLIVKDFHAEQLIVYYFQKRLGLDLNAADAEKIRIGITKLCCETCGSTLSQFARISVRGTHHVRYTNVADVFRDKSCTPVKISSNRITEPDPSPGDTPFDITSPGLRGAVYSSSCQQLLFHNSPQLVAHATKATEKDVQVGCLENTGHIKKEKTTIAGNGQKVNVSEGKSDVMSPVGASRRSSYAEILLGGTGADHAIGSPVRGRFDLYSETIQSLQTVISAAPTSSCKKKNVRFKETLNDTREGITGKRPRFSDSPRGVGGSESFFSPKAANSKRMGKHKEPVREASEQIYGSPIRGISTTSRFGH